MGILYIECVVRTYMAHSRRRREPITFNSMGGFVTFTSQDGEGFTIKIQNICACELAYEQRGYPNEERKMLKKRYEI